MLKPALTSCSILLFWCILLAGQPRGAPPQPPPPAGTAKVNGKDGLKYVWITAGVFQMGCSEGDAECFDNEKPVHEVVIKGFWLGQTELTQAAYQRVVETSPSYFKGAQLPVERVSWIDAQSYCRAVGMRLPTEAEWEYAARAGGEVARYGIVDRVAWYADNSFGGSNGRETHVVGLKPPNAWGLYDMLGNVWEWVADWYGPYHEDFEVDPAGPATGNVRVLRGGSWNYASRSARASQRLSGVQDDHTAANFGLRCAGD
jgi:formylglycine-generating enzyme required for sulfatase activity